MPRGGLTRISFDPVRTHTRSFKRGRVCWVGYLGRSPYWQLRALRPSVCEFRGLAIAVARLTGGCSRCSPSVDEFDLTGCLRWLALRPALDAVGDPAATVALRTSSYGLWIKIAQPRGKLLRRSAGRWVPEAGLTIEDIAAASFPDATPSIHDRS